MKIIVRKAQPADADGLAKVITQSWKAAYCDLISPEDLEKWTNYDRRLSLFERITQPEYTGHLLVALIHGIVVGFSLLDMSRDADLSGSGEIWAIYTLAECWGHGVGHALMEETLHLAESLGYFQLFLWVLTDNLRARRFYKKFGFLPDGATKASSFSSPIEETRLILRLK